MTTTQSELTTENISLKTRKATSNPSQLARW